MKFYIEWEIPIIRAIYSSVFYAKDEQKAKELFKTAHPRGTIRKIEGYHGAE